MVALETLSHQDEDPRFGEVISDCATQVASGHAYSHSLAPFKKVFSRVYVALVTVGERTGQLDDALERLATWQEQDAELIQRVRGALFYPSFVLALTAVLTLLLFYTVMPGFLSIFEELRIELPWPTRVLLFFANVVDNPGTWVFSIPLALFAWTALRDVYRLPKGGVAIFRFLLSVPVVGGLLYHSTNARYAATAATLLDSGLDLPRVLRMSGRASGSKVLEFDAESLARNVEEGQMVSQHMAARPEIYPVTLAQMVLAGEESARLDIMLARAADYFDLEMRFRVDGLGAALEPVLIGLIGFIVGFILLALLVPLYTFLGTLT